MASSKSRQRDVARAKYHRQMVRKAAAERRRRQIQAGLGAGLAVVLIVVGSVWLLGGFDKDKSATAADICVWSPVQGAEAGVGIKDVGTPPTKGILTSGTKLLNITFSAGLVSAELDLRNAPCTSASFAYLASKNFFDNTSCHRLMDKGDYVLQCGDPSGSGSGGPAYEFADEYLPPASAASPEPSAAASPSAAPAPPVAIYPAGTLAMANSGSPGTNGSQFFIVYKDSPFPPNYTIFGRITTGLDVILKIAAGGQDGKYEPQPGGGKPKNEALIQSMTVTEVQPPAASPAPDSSGTPAPTPSAPASGASTPPQS